MAQLLLIKVNASFKTIGDKINVFEDTHSFSYHELQVFNVLYINGIREDVQNKIDQIKIRTERAYYWGIDQTWRFQKPDVEGFERIKVWFDPPNRWRKLVNSFKYPINVQDLTPEEIQILATVDINHPSVDSFIRKIVKDISADPANMEEIRDLRNLEP